MPGEDFKLWKLVCEFCGFWKIVKRLDEYAGTEVKRPPVQRNIPRSQGDNTVPGNLTPVNDSCRRFRCLGCGRLISGRQITDTVALGAELERRKQLKEEAERR